MDSLKPAMRWVVASLVLFECLHLPSVSTQETNDPEALSQEFRDFEDELEAEYRRQGIEFDRGYIRDFKYAMEGPVPKDLLDMIRDMAVDLAELAISPYDCVQQVYSQCFNFIPLLPALCGSKMCLCLIHCALWACCCPINPALLLLIPFPTTPMIPPVYEGNIESINWSEWVIPKVPGIQRGEPIRPP